MAGIPENLKQLRLSKNLTQEGVAQKIGLTRQAISSYESGRTQPGIELLMRFAEIYEVELEDILYGRKGEQTAGKRVKTAAVLLIAFWWLLHLVHGSFAAVLHILFSPGDGALAGENLRTYFRLLEIMEKLMGVGLLLSAAGWLILLALDLSGRYPLPWKHKAAYFAVYTAGALALSFFWSWVDPVYSAWDLISAVLMGTGIAAAVLLLNFAVHFFRRRRRTEIFR